VTPHDDPWLAHTVRIARVLPEIAGVQTYDLEFDDPAVAATFRYRPGQFNMLYLPGAGEAAISVSGDPADHARLRHTVREAGNVTHTLAALRAGDTLGLRGPFGSAWPVDASAGKDVLVVAGGIGLAPLRPVIYEVLGNPGRFDTLTVLHGARTPDGLLYPAEYDDWRRRGATVQTTVDRADTTWTGHVGVVTLLLDRLPLPRPEDTVVMICGPELMMWFTAQAALRRRVPVGNVWLSLERNMNCAVALCGHCQFGPHFVCREGPVLPFPKVAPYLRVEGL
jgi:NAD(P)H-flavin reductase